MTNVIKFNPTTTPAQATEVAIAEWLRLVMGQHDLSTAAWARKAGISDTSISRFLKHGTPVPKAVTLAKLASAVGLPPPSFSAETQGLVDIPVILPAIFYHQGLKAARMSAVEVTNVVAKHRACVGFRVTADGASEVGIRVGDMVVVETERRPAPGNMVAVALADGTGTVLEWQPPFLLPRGGALATLRADDPSLKIVGVCVQLQRDLAL